MFLNTFSNYPDHRISIALQLLLLKDQTVQCKHIRKKVPKGEICKFFFVKYFQGE